MGHSLRTRTTPEPWASGGGGGADGRAGGAARPGAGAGGDRPVRPPAAGPDHRQGWAEVSRRLGGAWMPGLYALLA